MAANKELWRSTDSGANWVLISTAPDWIPRSYFAGQIEGISTASTELLEMEINSISAITASLTKIQVLGDYITVSLGGNLFYPLVNTLTFDNNTGQRGVCSFHLYDQNSTYSFMIGENIEIYYAGDLLWSGVIDHMNKKVLTTTGMYHVISGVTWNYACDKRRVINTYVQTTNLSTEKTGSISIGAPQIYVSPTAVAPATDIPILFHDAPSSTAAYSGYPQLTTHQVYFCHTKVGTEFSVADRLNGAATDVCTFTMPSSMDITWTEYTAGTTPLSAGYVVSDIIENYLYAEGITKGTVKIGAIPDNVVFNYIKPSNCFDILAEQSGYIWQVNADKTLDFIPVDYIETGISIGASEIKNTIYTKSNPKYRNTQYVVGGMELTDLMTESQFGDSTRIAYTMSFPVMKEPTIIVTGATSSKTVGLLGTTESYQWFWQKYSNIISQNATDTPLASTDTISVSYYGGFPTVALARNTTAIESLATYELGSGVVEDVVLRGKETLISENQILANSLVSKYSTNTDCLKFDTMKTGITPGKLITVNYPDFGLSSSPMLVDSVSVKDEDLYLWYSVSCLSGPELGGWSKFFEDLMTRTFEKDIWAGAVSGDIIIVSTDWAETTVWTEETTESVYDCPTPAPTSTSVFPETTLYPC